MKTTKRSKMLLSSIAMLLVALVALGSATYAWYTLNSRVTASKVTVKASAPEGLMISENSSTGWTNAITWSDGETTLEPSSITFAAPEDTMDEAADIITSQVKIKAASQSAYGKDGTTTAPSTAKIAKTFYVKSTGATTLNDVVATLTPGGTVTNTYVNAVLVDFTTESVLACVNSAGTMNGYLTSAGVETAFASPYNSWSTSAVTSAGKTYSKDQVHTIGLVVYVDGENSNCTTDNAAAAALNAVEFDVAFSSATLAAM